MEESTYTSPSIFKFEPNDTSPFNTVLFSTFRLLLIFSDDSIDTSPLINNAEPMDTSLDK